jgi:tetratricopeptide (TPR) repeat protein
MKQVTIAIGLMSVVVLSACTKDPQIAKAKYFAAGQNYMKNGKYGDAAIEFRNAVRLDPRFVEAYYQLAQADLARNDWSSRRPSIWIRAAWMPGWTGAVCTWRLANSTRPETRRTSSSSRNRRTSAPINF